MMMDETPSSFDGYTTQQQQQQHSPRTSTIDIISIGSLLKQSNHLAQQRTFANTTTTTTRTKAVVTSSSSSSSSSSSYNVRTFYSITEMNDTDTTCFTSLTSEQFQGIVQFCHTEGNSIRSNSDTTDGTNHHHPNPVAKVFYQNLFQPKKHAGYMCAQKRMIDGLYKALQPLSPPKQQQKKRKQLLSYNLPDYLFIIEDDTYMNLDLIVPELQMRYPPNLPYAITGSPCTTITIPDAAHENSNTTTTTTMLTLPQIGYGMILTKASIQRLLQPIYDTDQNHFSKLVQYQLSQNQMGELNYFTNGMTVLEFIYTWASHNLYTNIDLWKENSISSSSTSINTKNQNTGYCFTSDTALAYFIHYCFITVPEDQLEKLSSLLLSLQNSTTTAKSTIIVDPVAFDTIRRQTNTFVHLAVVDSSTDSNNVTSTTSSLQQQCSPYYPTTQNDPAKVESLSSCTIHDRICHKMTPEQMDQLHQQYYHTTTPK
jgi:hypothetical protein